MSIEVTKREIELKYTEYTFGEVLPGDQIIGQDKALGLIRLGLSMTRPGYNIFIAGDDGSGRLTALKEEISRIEGDTSLLSDVAYLFNSNHQDRPICMVFPRGQASAFQEDLEKLGEKTVTKEALMDKWNQDPRLQKFLDTLPEKEDYPDAYRINILLDRKRSTRRPLVIETHPSHQSLFGYVEKDMVPHLSVRAGSYQEASGGFLVLDAKEVTGNEELWTTLKRYLEMTSRALSSTAVQGEMMSSIRPYPIPILTKVILLGTEDIYDKLTDEDENFLKFFKISPEFDYWMEANEKNIKGTVSYLKKAGSNMLPQEDSAYHEILRFSSWVAEDRKKLTTQLSVLGDLLEEANIDALQKGASSITANHVMAALQKRDYFGSMAEEHINREIQDGVMVMSLKGSQVGIVNGLAVMDRGLSSFGTPCVISATVAPGTEGIVNIEHEAGLSGGIHDKGLLILEGYLRRRYAQTFPLSLYAGICFEQNYGGVDGDSASSAELYALLSAIGCFPVRQDIAVTGSVNQMGELQPVGGINEKIQGFFNACSTMGLTGTQGVIIPIQNKSSLILPRMIEEAIEQGTFHIWAISSIDEGLKLLSGMEGGERDRRGNYPTDSFNRVIEDELKELYRSSQNQR